MGILFPYDLLYGVYATCSFTVQKKCSWLMHRSISVQGPTYLKITYLPRTLWNAFQTTSAASGFFLRRTTFSTWTQEQKRFSIHTQPRHLRGHGDGLLAGQHPWEQEHGSEQLILGGWVCSQSLNGLSFGGGKKEFQVHNIQRYYSRWVSKFQKDDFICMTLKKNLCKVRKCNNLKKSYLYIYKL